MSNWRGIATRVSLAVALLGGLAQAHASTDKATWITETFNYTLSNMGRVDALMWYNNANPGEPDWRIVPTPALAPPGDPVVAAYNSASATWTANQKTRGVFINGAPQNSSLLTTFESQVGNHDRVGWYESFASDFPLANVQTTAGHGSRPYIVWEPYDVNVGVTSTGNQSLLPRILSSDPAVNYDARIRSWAQAAKAFGGEIDIALGHEMNGFWRSWGYLPENFYNNPRKLTAADLATAGHNGNTPQMFVDVFRRVVDIFDSEGASNVNFVWDVNADWVDNFSVAFPGVKINGQTYADRMGMNGFNWGLTQQGDPNWLGWSDWREGGEIFNNWNGFSTYSALCSLDPTLPIIIGETGTNHTPEPASFVFLAAGSLLLLKRRKR